MDKYLKELLFKYNIFKIFWNIRIKIKLLLRNKNIRNISFCKRCGRDIRDFEVSDKEWNEVIKGKINSCCYDCFQEIKYINNHKKEFNNE